MNLPWLSDQFNGFVRRASEGSLHHALLFSGPRGIGKSVLAESIAQALLCQQLTEAGACQHCSACNLYNASTHPDYHVIESEKQIGVDAIREVIISLNQTAQMGGNKVCLIRAADSMTESAANALLKTLEEPTRLTFIILLVEEVHRLLPTIISRCEKWVFNAPDPVFSMQWLDAHHKDKGPFNENLLAAYGGAPFKLLDAMVNQADHGFDQFENDMDELLVGNKDPLKLAEAWQTEAASVLNWCQLRCQAEYARDARQAIRDTYLLSIDTARRLQNPGINRTLLVYRIFQSMRQSLAHQQLAGN